ncbi:MAG: hypothetical protein WDN28_23035 [Chthoniobacter sp.]
MKLGPDGALWIADFYNPIIGHYEFPLGDPRRDHAHGRIWRIVYRGEGKSAGPLVPDLSVSNVDDLVEKLANPNLTLRTLATNELVARTGKSPQETLRKVIKPDGFVHDPDTKDPSKITMPFWETAPAVQRAHALIALYRLSAAKSVEPDFEAFDYARLKENDIARTLALKMSAEAHEPWTEADVESVRYALSSDAPPLVKRAAWEVLAAMPGGLKIRDLIPWLPPQGHGRPGPALRRPDRAA